MVRAVTTVLTDLRVKQCGKVETWVLHIVLILKPSVTAGVGV